MLALALLAATLVVAAAARHGHDGEDIVGRPFPALELRGLDATVTSLRTFSGQVVVLNFWATWCAPCRQEMDSLELLSRSVDGARVAVIGVSVDTDANLVREEVVLRGWGFARYIDPGRALSRAALPFDELPRTYVIAPDGRVALVATGARDWTDVKVRARLLALATHRAPAAPASGPGEAASPVRNRTLADLAIPWSRR